MNSVETLDLFQIARMFNLPPPVTTTSTPYDPEKGWAEMEIEVDADLYDPQQMLERYPRRLPRPTIRSGRVEKSHIDPELTDQDLPRLLEAIRMRVEPTKTTVPRKRDRSVRSTRRGPICQSILQNRQCALGHKCPFGHHLSQVKYGEIPSCRERRCPQISKCRYRHSDETRRDYCVRLGIRLRLRTEILN